MGLLQPQKAELLNYTPDISCVINVGDLLPQTKHLNVFFNNFYFTVTSLYICMQKEKWKKLFTKQQKHLSICLVGDAGRMESHPTSCKDN